MRFARLQCDHERAPAGLEELAAQELDFLQLDYPRPRVVEVDGDSPVAIPGCALGFCQAVRALVKTLFLQPEFRVITSAGWSDAYGCVERTARVLVDGGCGDLPMSAVRGSNLLPIIDMLEADGVDLKNAETGTPWRELREPILAADLQLGAGPLATALAEHARVVIAGHYDGVSPAIAHAVREFGWSWADQDLLASAATAARAAEWRHWSLAGGSHSSLHWTPGWVELDGSGGMAINVAVADEAAVAAAKRWVQATSSGGESLTLADVRVDVSAINCRANGPRQIVVDGAKGGATDDHWRLEVLYQSGYAAEALVDFTRDAEGQLRQYFVDAARSHLLGEYDSSGLFTVEPLQSASGTGIQWLHLACQSKTQKHCRDFVDETVRLISTHEPFVRLATGPPRVHAHCGVWPVRLPRDAVDIAVETRPAKEWI